MDEAKYFEESVRQDSFFKHWPIERRIKANDCAKEGFYYTGMADRVRCAFCGGVLKNWSNGERPADLHKRFFSFCPFIQGKSQNVPADGSCRGNGLMYEMLAIPAVRNQDAQPGARVDEFENLDLRRQTYDRYPPGANVPVDDLCAAGFLYIGSGNDDKVQCFWCRGILDRWEQGDDPWRYHAMFFPGCTWLQTQRDLGYIRTVRAEMTDAESEAAQPQDYNSGDTSFLDAVDPPVHQVPLAVAPVIPVNPPAPRSLRDLVAQRGALTDVDARVIERAIMCELCHDQRKAAALMPCGCFLICKQCAQDSLPDPCPSCKMPVSGHFPINFVLKMPSHLTKEKRYLSIHLYKKEISQRRITSEKKMLSNARQLFGETEWTFQDDNAPCHRARLAKSWVDDSGVSQIDRPAQSLDLNPTENLWQRMSTIIAKDKPTNKKELIEKVINMWHHVVTDQS
ncbi:baculoviral IAP repeat-containing protein 7-B-like [Watersipora subatra]|uniref:baculoviral IAP repeat-containing protein 7-B-like n=1 Tax=Watersipora subatra TaxID=2589382 RepID=UPI00355B9B3C